MVGAIVSVQVLGCQSIEPLLPAMKHFRIDGCSTSNSRESVSTKIVTGPVLRPGGGDEEPALSNEEEDL